MQKGQSGMKPKKVGSKTGAYAYSDNRMGGANTPNKQGWNSYSGGPKRGGNIKGNGGGMKRSGKGMDY